MDDDNVDDDVAGTGVSPLETGARRPRSFRRGTATTIAGDS